MADVNAAAKCLSRSRRAAPPGAPGNRLLPTRFRSVRHLPRPVSDSTLWCVSGWKHVGGRGLTHTLLPRGRRASHGLCLLLGYADLGQTSDVPVRGAAALQAECRGRRLGARGLRRQGCRAVAFSAPERLPTSCQWLTGSQMVAAQGPAWGGPHPQLIHGGSKQQFLDKTSC